jgi:hypothetical protein
VYVAKVVQNSQVVAYMDCRYWNRLLEGERHIWGIATVDVQPECGGEQECQQESE